MKIDINTATEQFKEQLISVINQAGEVLPPVLIKYVVLDIYNDVNQTYEAILKRQQLQEAKEPETKDEDKEN